MTSFKPIAVALVAVALCATAGPAVADQIFFDFVDHDDIEYGSWVENGLTLTAAETGTGIIADTIYGTLFVDSILDFDLSTLTNVRSAEVVVKTLFREPTVVIMREGETVLDEVQNQQTNVMELIVVGDGGGTPMLLRLDLDDAILESVLIRHGPVGDEPTTWSDVKTLFR